MEDRLRYNFRGIISAPVEALKAKKILVCSLYILGALFIYDIFVYLASVLDGSSSFTYSSFGLLPVTLLRFEGTFAALLYYIGIGLSGLILMIGAMAIAIMDIENLRGNPFVSASEAIGFSLKRAKPLLLSWLAIVLFLGFIVLLGMIIGLITRLPFVGEFLYSFFFFFPNFIVAIFAVLIIFIMFIGILLSPAAVSAEIKGETFNSILGLFSTIIRQPVRWTAYTLYTAAAGKIAAFIFAYFAFRAVQFLKLVTSVGGGSKIDNIISSGMMHLPIQSDWIMFTTNIFPGIRFGFDISRISTGVAYEGITAYISAVSLFLIFLIIWGYIFSIVATGQTYTYLIIRKIRGGSDVTGETSIFSNSEKDIPSPEEDFVKLENSG